MDETLVIALGKRREKKSDQEIVKPSVRRYGQIGLSLLLTRPRFPFENGSFDLQTKGSCGPRPAVRRYSDEML